MLLDAPAMLCSRSLARVTCLFAPALLVVTTGCNGDPDDGPLDIAMIADSEELSAKGPDLPFAARHLRAATREGLVTLDAAGEVVPAIAERWIVTDDGSNYIFRLRDTSWPDGSPITASEVRDLIRQAIARQNGTPLGVDLDKVTAIRAMTGRIVEIRLSSPMPELLRLLAQPELGLVHGGGGTGPMVSEDGGESAGANRDGGAPVELHALPPTMRGLPVRADWEETARTVTVRAMPAVQAVDAFQNGTIGLVMGGTIVDFPLAQTGPLSRGTIQVDPALGLLGLAFADDTGLLADPERREALSMAIDRETLIEPFGLSGWQPETWIVPRALFDRAPYPAARWSEGTLDQRRAVAARRIAAYAARRENEPTVAVWLPDGPGSDILFDELASAWRAIGVETVRASSAKAADLVLFDRLARYSSPRWFLNQFACSLRRGPCALEADALVRESLDEWDPQAKQALLAQAHAELIAAEVFIPLGMPVRWSLVRGSASGFQPNPWGLHPLFALSQPTT